MPHESEIYARLQDGFVTSAQIDPPMRDIENFDHEVGLLRQADVSVVDVNSRSKLSLDSIDLSERYSTMYGFLIIPHITPQDATIFGLEKRILTAHEINKICDFLVISGDPRRISNTLSGYPNPDSIETIAAIDAQLRRSSFELPLKIGAAFNQNAINQDLEQKRTKQKRQAGADFYMSQPVFSTEQIEKTVYKYRKSLDQEPVPMMMGIWPFVSKKDLEKVHIGKIDGVKMEEDDYEEAVAQLDDESLKVWSKQKVVELVKYIRGNRYAQGVYVVAPFRRPSEAIFFLQEIGSL